MKFMLDSNVLIAILKQDHRVMEQIRRYTRDDLCTSSIVKYELLFGALKSDFVERNLMMVETLPYETLDFTLHDAFIAGEIRVKLEAKGTPIGPYDTLIAGQALARDLALVTRNTREFSRIEGLRVENWES